MTKGTQYIVHFWLISTGILTVILTVVLAGSRKSYPKIHFTSLRKRKVVYF